MNVIDQVNDMMKAQEIIRLTCRKNKGSKVYDHLRQLDKDITFAINLMICTKDLPI